MVIEYKGVVGMPKRELSLAVAMGRRMYELRRQRNLTQENVAELAGISHQQYNKAEKGKVCIKSDTLFHIAKALNTSADFLLTGNENCKNQEIISLLQQMDEEQLQFAKQAIQWMIRLFAKR